MVAGSNRQARGATVGAGHLFAEVMAIFRGLLHDIINSYRPELHYMRGPGPKWQEKHALR